MKLKTRSAVKKRIRITKTGKLKRLQAARSHLRRNKGTRANTLLDVSRSNNKVKRFIVQ